MLGPINLTPAEAETNSAIKLDQETLFHDSDAALTNGELALALMRSLLARGAIPEARWKYFDDPTYRTGRVKGSYRQLFERNGTVGDDIYRHPNFLKHLRYFLIGSNLPYEAIQGFSTKAFSYGHVGPSDALELGKLARDLTRKYNLAPYDAADEFYKLALDFGIYHRHAMRIRDAVEKMR